MLRINNIIYFDYGWQYPAITEQHAFAMALKILPKVDGVIYFAFPWASLIDFIDRKKNDDIQIFTEALEAGSKLVNPDDKIVTVCQHIRMLNHQDIFHKYGITDVFWSHSVKGQNFFPQFNDINIYPFPLYPVQAVDYEQSYEDKNLHFSFVGARSNQWYLTQSRNMIIDNLSDIPDSLVIGRESWHYNKVVYDKQINKRNDISNLIDEDKTSEYIDILKNSIFSLCPSGSGPNSIRLWESIGFGSIPIILADTYQAPGSIDLWNSCSLFVKENIDEIINIPELIRGIISNKTKLTQMQNSLRLLWYIYGPDCFIYDIQLFFLENSKLHLLSQSNSLDINNLLAESKKLNSIPLANENLKLFNFFALQLAALTFRHPDKIRVFISENNDLDSLVRKLIDNDNLKYNKLLSMTLRLRSISLSK